MDAIKTLNVNDLTIEIYHDENPESPREWDNLGTMLYKHPRYILGDREATVEEIEEITGDDNYLWLPTYIYDHSGVTMNTSGFSCPWDSGQVGIIYVSKDDIRKEYGKQRISKMLKNKVYCVLRSEVRTFDQYLRGDVYGYMAKKGDEVIESCWGFYGLEYCEEEATEIAKYETEGK